ncbi:MAG: HNH endonuclease [Gammaproteobacteria bacterium]|nr:MAG: HNH endonuclease [Gammaproteobacteria bacterium]
MDAAEFIVAFQDYLAPKLDMYEQAIYLYVYRHSRLVGQDEAVIGFKSARKRVAFGVGKQGTPPSEHVVYEKVRSLEQKGCLKVLNSERAGTRLRLFLPNEIPGLVPLAAAAEPFNLEAVDFFDVPEHREAILRREDHKCFYCRRRIDAASYVIEHVISRPVGDNSYRNVVAACRQCNNRKGTLAVDEFLRILYREGLLSQEDFQDRRSHLVRLRAGELKPVVHAS